MMFTGEWGENIMKVVNIEDFFFPDAGYQVNLVSKYLAQFGHEVYIVTSTLDGIHTSVADFFGTDSIETRDVRYTEQTGAKIVRIPPVIKKVISGRIIQSKVLFRTVEDLQPDVVYVHGNDTLTGIRYLRKNKRNYALVTDSHMLSIASRNRFNKAFYWFYRKAITPRIIKNQIPVIRTQNDQYVERCLGIPLAQAPWISYGSDTQLFHPDGEVKKTFREKNGISEADFVVVYTGKLDESKGGKLLAQAFRKKFRTDKNVTLIVVGSTLGDYGREVEKCFSESENRVIRFPTQKYYDLAQFYQAADLSVFAKQCSLSFYDAQACGLPVLSEDNNINVDRCSHGNGWNFKANDVQDFRTKVEAAVNLGRDEYRVIADNAYQFIIENYNYEDKAREYEKILLREYQKYKDKIL